MASKTTNATIGNISTIIRQDRGYSIGVALPASTSNQSIEDMVKQAIADRFPARPGSPIPKPQPPKQINLTPDQLRALAARSVSSIKSFEVIVPGRHYNGLSNQDLLEIFRNNDRDFVADTNDLRDYLRTELLAGMGGTVSWDDDAAGQIIQKSIIKFCAERIVNQGSDVSLKPLSRAYLQEKVSNGYDSRIGIRRGKFLTSFRKARVRLMF